MAFPVFGKIDHWGTVALSDLFDVQPEAVVFIAD
jgi:hypothetical protein